MRDPVLSRLSLLGDGTSPRLLERLDGLWWEADVGDPPRTVLVRFGGLGDRLVCTGLIVAGESPSEVGARRLRGLPLQKVAKRVAEWVTLMTPEVEAKALAALAEGPEATARSRALIASLRAAAETPAEWPGPRKLTTARLTEIAAAYRAAVASGDRAPVQRLSAKFRRADGTPTPEATVRRWLQLCRQRRPALLAPAAPGKAGEVDA